MSIGTKVRTLRKAADLSAEQLAVRAGISSATIGRLERGDQVPKIAILSAIARELGTSAADLLEAS